MKNEMDNNDYDGERDLIYLTFEDDEEVECEVVGVFEVEGKEYIALLPVDEDEVFLYEYKDLGDEFDLIPIEDDKELELVSEAYFELFEDDLEYDEE